MTNIINKIDKDPVRTGLVGAAFLCVYFFVNTMTLPLDHNEHMYVTAGYLARNLELYRDFAFLQMPYLPILYDAVFRVTQSEHLLFVGRICTLFFTILSCVFLWIIVLRITNRHSIAHISVFVFGFSYYIQDISAEAANYMMPMAATLLGMLVFQHVLRKPDLRLPQMFCLGLTLAFAAGTKLYYAPFVLPFIICSIIYPRYEQIHKKLLEQAGPLILGFCVGLLPVVHYIINYPEAFWFNNFDYHLLNSRWRGFYPGLNIGYRFDSTIKILSAYPSNLAFSGLIAIIMFKCVKAIRKDMVGRFLLDPMATLSAMLLIVGFGVAIVPLPLFVYYFATAFPFAIILGCSMLKRASFSLWSPIEKTVATLGILVIIGSASVTFSQRLGPFTRLDSWTPIQAHNISKKISAELGPEDRRGKIATLSPLYAIEARLPIYVQFSTGPFIFRVGNMLTPSELNRFKGVSPDTLSDLFRKEPPVAIIVGHERAVEASLIAYGDINRPREERFESLTVFSAGKTIQ